MSAKIIEVEGTDGAGKTTALKYLIEKLRASGKTVLETREVGSPLIPVCVKLREIVLAPEAVEDFRKLKANLRAEVRAALETHLRHEPKKVSRSRIKRLRGLRRPQYRLRVGDVRVFYDVSETTVEILAIVSKSEAETWLAQYAEPE